MYIAPTAIGPRLPLVHPTENLASTDDTYMIHTSSRIFLRELVQSTGSQISGTKAVRLAWDTPLKWAGKVEKDCVPPVSLTA
jgi:hypothetical protein